MLFRSTLPIAAAMGNVDPLCWDTGPIAELLDQGCDLDLDVLPTVAGLVPGLARPLRSWDAPRGWSERSRRPWLKALATRLALGLGMLAQTALASLGVTGLGRFTDMDPGDCDSGAFGCQVVGHRSSPLPSPRTSLVNALCRLRTRRTKH